MISTYDVMLYYWLDHTDYQFFQLHSLLHVPVFNVIYAILSALLTFLTHYFILKHLMECFVNLPDLSETLQKRRYDQNISNFKKNIACTCFRFVMTFPMFLTSLFPVDFLKHTEGILVYLSLHLLSSIYESCGPSFGYLSNRLAFERRSNRIGHCSDHKKITVHDRVGNITVGPTVFHNDDSRISHHHPPGNIQHDMKNVIKPIHQNVKMLQAAGIDGGSKTSSGLSQYSARKMFSEWKSKSKKFVTLDPVNPVILDPYNLTKKQKWQTADIPHEVVTSRYCKKHFESFENIPQSKRIKTKIYVLKKGKVQEETEENIGWLYYNKDKNKLYMKKPNCGHQCPMCKGNTNYPTTIQEKPIKSKELTNLHLHQNGLHNQKCLQLRPNMFSERNSDSGMSILPSTRLVYKDFETN